jgi:hypothetical protein
MTNLLDIDLEDIPSQNLPNTKLKDNFPLHSSNPQDTPNSKENTSKKQQEGNLFMWKKLDSEWQEKLMSDAFYVKDCLGDGNCQFRSIETALADAGYRMSHEKLRRLIAQYINQMSNDEFLAILQNYRLEKEHGEFEGDWNPYQVKSKREFINHVTKSGFHFQGDNITLSLLSKAIKIDFVIFDDNYNITNLSNPDDLQDKIVILYYIQMEKGGHYMTIGIKSPRGKIYTIFNRGAFPQVLDQVLDRHTFLLTHITQIYKNYGDNLKLNTLVKELQKRLQTKLAPEDKKHAYLILRGLLENEEFFRRAKSAKKNQSKSPRKSKSRKSKPKSPRKSRSKSKSKSPRKSKSKSPRKSKSRKSKPKSPRKSRSKSKSKSPRKSKSKSPRKSKSKSPRKSKPKSPRKSKPKSPRKSQSKSTSKSPRKSPRKSKSKSPRKSKSKSPRKSKSKSPRKSKSKSPRKSKSKSPRKSRSKRKSK